jgi:hypothetical protein
MHDNSNRAARKAARIVPSGPRLSQGPPESHMKIVSQHPFLDI